VDPALKASGPGLYPLYPLGALTLALTVTFAICLFFLQFDPGPGKEGQTFASTLWDTMIAVFKFGQQPWLPGSPGYMLLKLLMFFTSLFVAIVNNPLRQTDDFHIVAAVEQPHNMEVLELAGRGRAEVLPSLDILAKITAQTCRQPGLPVVYTELMRFQGNEFYFLQDQRAVGRTFGELCFSFSQAVPLGIERVAGEVLVNPPGQTVMERGDSLIILARTY